MLLSHFHFRELSNALSRCYNWYYCWSCSSGHCTGCCHDRSWSKDLPVSFYIVAVIGSIDYSLFCSSKSKKPSYVKADPESDVRYDYKNQTSILVAKAAAAPENEHSLLSKEFAIKTRAFSYSYQVIFTHCWLVFTVICTAPFFCSFFQGNMYTNSNHMRSNQAELQKENLQATMEDAL